MRLGHDSAGVRAVAVFEAVKGLLVVAAGLGLLSLLHRDVQHAAESIVRHLHLNPARHYPRVFIQAASQMSSTRLWLLAGGAFAYAAVRFVEAYGLWHLRPWAEWFAILAGGVYLPVEAYELLGRATVVRAAILLGNTAIVVYLLYVRWSAAERERRPMPLNRTVGP
ncbi:MAG: DUF2127 domain-containing protein [Acidobacteria bacterium]|nr:MAG: DUF2127 domain-containing protein [Acidobacteriota bacterium]